MHASRGGLGTCWASLSLSLALAVLSAAVPSAARGDRIKIDESKWQEPSTFNEQVATDYLSNADCADCHEAPLLPKGPAILGLGNNFTRQWLAVKDVNTIFVNPAISLTARFFSSLEPTTLAMRAEPDKTLEPPEGEAIPPVRVPPWWRVKDKNASFYIASARGNRVTHMMIADLLKSPEKVAEKAASIKELHDDTFVQVAAYIRNHTSAPKFASFQADYKVDQTLAADGEKVFNAQCAFCHAPKGVTLLVTTDDMDSKNRKLGTDEALCNTPGNRKIDADWFNASLLATKLGGKAEAPAKCAYVAPPLSGIWAAAPYFHNGSVPTLEGVLKSELRPAMWAYAADGDPEKRVFDPTAVGWKVYTEEVRPKRTASEVTYNTNLPGYSNKGHTYGDLLKDDERKALIEYLKTL